MKTIVACLRETQRGSTGGGRTPEGPPQAS